MPDDLLKTINFKYLNVEKLTKSTPICDNLHALKSLQPDRPMLVTEFWAGWFDYWGHERNLLNNEVFERTLKEILKRGASVNFYMFHGGTNFGFMNGAIELEKGYYTADVTSYDYDCPVDESGNRTQKWEIIRKCIGESLNEKASSEAYKNESEAYGEFEIEKTSLLSELGEGKEFEEPTNMENLDQAFGYTSYSVFIEQPTPEKPQKESEKEVEDIEDETMEPVLFKNLLKSIRGRYRVFFTAPGGHKSEVFCNQLLSEKCCSRDEFDVTENFSAERRSFLVEFLVENPGRVNFSNLKDQRMGMLSGKNMPVEFSIEDF